jgi:hypothetical protein
MQPAQLSGHASCIAIKYQAFSSIKAFKFKSYQKRVPDTSHLQLLEQQLQSFP